MREMLKYGLRLMLFAAIAGLLLSVVNAVTEEPIAEQIAAKVKAAREEVIGKYDFFPVEADLSEYPLISGVYAAGSLETPAGYVFELDSKGYAGTVSISLGVNTSGAITGVSVSNHSETKGLGTSDEKPFLTAFYGMAASPEKISGVDAMTGATISSNAVKNALAQALAFSEEVLGIKGKSDPYLAYVEEPDSEMIVRKAISQMLPGSTTSKLDLFEGYRTLNALYFATDDDGETLYVYRATATTESGRTHLLIALDENGTVRSAAVESYDENIIYLIDSIEHYLAAVEEAGDVEGVDAISGATYSCDAIAENVREAQTHLKTYLAEGGEMP